MGEKKTWSHMLASHRNEVGFKYKHLIHVHLKILNRSVENVASHLLTKYIT